MSPDGGSLLEFRVPDVGEGLSEAEILSWRVAPGDAVERDQVIAEVQTDKSVVELPAPSDGVVERLGGEVGDVLPVGAVLAVFRVADVAAGDGDPAGAAPEDDRGAAPAGTAADDGGAAPAAAGVRGGRRPLASPATRKLALERGVDLREVEGSGPGGRILKEDVERAAESGGAPSAPADRPGSGAAAARGQDEVVPLRGLRRRIARTMTEAWQQVPHITDLREVDASGLVHARERLRAHLEAEGVRFTFLPLLVKAVVATLAQHPKLNASLDLEAETVTYHAACNLGIATATDDGLIVPVLHDADRLSLVAIAQETERLAQAARQRRVTPAETSGGTCTITNTGTYGGWLGTPIIRPPEAAIVGFGRIADTVVARDGEAVVRPTLPLSVAADHRLIDGHELGAFVATLEALLTEPVLLLAGDR